MIGNINIFLWKDIQFFEDHNIVSTVFFYITVIVINTNIIVWIIITVDNYCTIDMIVTKKKFERHVFCFFFLFLGKRQVIHEILFHISNLLLKKSF